MMPCVTRFLLAALMVAGASVPVQAQRVLIETTTLAATREVVNVYLQSAMLSVAPAMEPMLLPGPVQLPGDVPLGRVYLSDDQAYAFALSQSHQPSAPSFVTAVRTAPFEGVPLWDRIMDAGWRVDIVTTLETPGTGQRFLITAESHLAGPATQSPRLRVTALETIFAARDSRQEVYPLPGRAVALAPLPHLGRVAVLCEPGAAEWPGQTPAMLHIREIFGGRTVVDAMPLSGAGPGLLNPYPAALVMSADRTHLFALVGGDALSEGSTGPVSWLFARNIETGEEAAAPVEFPGVPDALSLLPAPDGAGCWAVTHSPRLRYGHLVRAALEGGRLVLEVQQPLGGAVEPPRLALIETLPGTAAVGVGNRVELWQNGMPTGVSQAFHSPVRALATQGARVLVGEANRVHSLALPTLSPLTVIAVQSGVIRSLHPLPHAGPRDDYDGDGLGFEQELARGTIPTIPDTNGDGIHDGVDPNPLAPTPRLEVPQLIVLQSEAIGAEVRAVPIYSRVDDDALRLVSVEPGTAPWLLVSPQSWRGPGAFYLGVDRAWFGAFPEPVDGRITVRLIDPITNRDAYGSPAEVTVRVLPPRTSVRRILWLVDGVSSPTALRAGDGPGFGELSRLLAASPHLFSHVVERTALDALSPYTVLVVDGTAAARGAILRQSVLDFVARGGALLFLVGALEGEAARNVARWLHPAGIRVQPGEFIEGAVPSIGAHPLAEAWGDFTVRQGARLDVGAPAQALASLSGQATAFAVAEYGRGRIAVVASTNPLSDAPMLRPANRRFAERLFIWLAMAGIDVRDIDGDGLPDHIEDRNGNGIVDPGETDPVNPDSDGDGIPDGMEDLNRNGRMDDGETSPINPDTDGDGTWDGADLEPLPMRGSPVIDAVEPVEGPAEGGTAVLLHGRNFAAGSTVYFGERPSPLVRMVAPNALRVDTPAASNDAVGLVPVRVVNPSHTLAGMRPAGFRYTPRSVITLNLRALRTADAYYNRAVAITLDEPPVAVGQIALRLHAAPGRVRWNDAVRSGAARFGERTVTSVVDASGDCLVTIGRPVPARATLGGELAVVPVHIEADSPGPITVTVTWSHILAPHGEPLEAETNALSLVPP